MIATQTGAGALGLYLHLPFCLSKCYYCDFNSIVAPQKLRRAYLTALVKEMRYYAADTRCSEREIGSVYLGGGTPTYYEADELSFLLTELRRHFVIPEGTEWSVEANPGTLNREKLQVLRRAGVNRISLGAQSFDDALLKLIGRKHSAREIVAAVSLIRDSGFTNYSLDLIFGLPEQRMQHLRETLGQALQLEPTHISVYGLQLEEGTELARQHHQGTLRLPDEEEEVKMLLLSREMLKDAGYEHYEVSNYALPGRRCAHNMWYWQNREYLGLGAGAYSYLQRQRFAHLTDPKRYVAAWQYQDMPVITECEHISIEMEQDETLMLGFRLLRGVDKIEFQARFGVAFDDLYAAAATDLLRRGLLCQEGSRLCPTLAGFIYNNQVCGAFLRTDLY